TGTAIAAVPVVPRPSRRVLALRAFLRTPSALVGLVVAAFWVVCAMFWPLFAPYDPYAQDYSALLARPSPAHLFGTDEYGRDVLPRPALRRRGAGACRSRRRRRGDRDLAHYCLPDHRRRDGTCRLCHLCGRVAQLYRAGCSAAFAGLGGNGERDAHLPTERP